MLSIILFCLILCIIACALHGRIRGRNVYKLPPSFPGELPIIGHMHILIVSGSKDIWSLLKSLTRYAVENGGVTYLQILRDKYYVIAEPEDALTVANSCLQKLFIYDFAKKLLGQGLITGGGEVYKRHRKLLGTRFTAPAVHTYLKLFNEQAMKLRDEIGYFYGKGPIDATNIIKRIVIETSYFVTFGFSRRDCKYLQSYNIAVHELTEMYVKRFIKAYLHNDIVYRLLGHQAKEDLLVKTLNKLTQKFIQDKKAEMKDATHENNSDMNRNEGVTFKSMLNYLLELDGLLTDQEIKEELDTNIAASYDTVSHTFINIMTMLGSHPAVQERVYEELMQVLGADRDVEKDDLQKLVYIKAVIKETLRLLPVVPFVGRYVDKDVKLKNYIMPAGSHCLIAPYGIQRSPAWGPDAEQFKPERWLNPDSLPANANYFAAFSMGKRSCVGTTYAIAFLTVLLAHLVRQSKWTTDSTKLKLQFYVTLKSTAGHEISIEKRTAGV